jgi:hypothetical protein
VSGHRELTSAGATIRPGKACADEPFPVVGRDVRSGSGDRRAGSSRGRGSDALATDLHADHRTRGAAGWHNHLSRSHCSRLAAVNGSRKGTHNPPAAAAHGRRRGMVEALLFHRAFAAAMMHSRRVAVARVRPQASSSLATPSMLARRTANSGRQRARHKAVNWRRSSAQAPLARPQATGPQSPPGAVRFGQATAADQRTRTASSARDTGRMQRNRWTHLTAVRAHVEVAVRNGLAAVVIPRPRLSLAAVAARRSWYEGGYE